MQETKTMTFEPQMLFLMLHSVMFLPANGVKMCIYEVTQ